MKVVIHAGIHRTGTTSLQGFLADNRETLLQLGVAYPGETPNHQPLAWSLKRKDSDAGDVRTLLESRGAVETAVLSAEDFCIQTDLKWLEQLSESFETKVVFYFRRQDHWLMSWYNQHVKWPFDRQKSQMDKTEFLEHIGDFHWLDYAALLNRWTAVLGEANVSAGIVESGQVEDVVGDFVKRLGISTEGLNFEIKRKNDSLPVHLLEIARHLGVFEMPPRTRARMMRALRVGLAHKTQSATTVYSPEERLRILQLFEASNRTAAKRFFGREKLFSEPSPGPNDPYFNFPELSRPDLIREWIAPVIKELLPSP